MRYSSGLDNRTEWIAYTLAYTALILFCGGIAQAAVTALAAAIIVVYRNAKIYRPLITFGAVSYSFYLTHCIIGIRVGNLAARVNDGPAVLALALLASILFAAIFWGLFEKPALQLSRRF